MTVFNLFGDEQEQPTTEDQIFEQFWRIYPRRVGKADARKKFHRAMQRAKAEELLEAATLFAEAPESVPGKPESVPYPSTWLNQDRWKNVRLKPRPTPGLRIPHSEAIKGPDWTKDPEALARNLDGLKAARAAIKKENL